jgi:pimeloyl-ACP methyl ester carboxylesterase
MLLLLLVSLASAYEYTKYIYEYTAGLLDALKIPKADVLGYSLGSFVAQQLVVTYPEKVNRLILVASSCGGKDSIPQPLQLVKLQSEIVNKSLGNIPIAPEEMKSLMSLSLGPGWISTP